MFSQIVIRYILRLPSLAVLLVLGEFVPQSAQAQTQAPTQANSNVNASIELADTTKLDVIKPDTTKLDTTKLDVIKPVYRPTLIAQAIAPDRSVPSVELPTPEESTPAVPEAPSQPEAPPQANPPQNGAPANPTAPTVPTPPKKVIDQAIERALGNTNTRFPAIVNPTATTVFSTNLIGPKRRQGQTDFQLQLSDQRLILNRFKFEHLIPDEQFYWVLPENRIVLETRGWQSEVVHQGQSSEAQIDQVVRLEQALWGMQFATTIPTTFSDLTGTIDPNSVAVKTIAAELITDPNNTAGTITIQSGNPNETSDRRSSILPARGSGSTYNMNGGGSLFENLAVDNVPLMLQGFPTHNLQALLEGEGIFPGATIENDVLDKIGFTWGNSLTGKGAKFFPKLSSNGGVKVGQGGKFDNYDLLNLLVNPYLTSKERQQHYYNSLFWVSLGQRPSKILYSRTQKDQADWHRFQLSQPHNRTLLQYDAKKSQATYTNVFANPGVSLSFSFGEKRIDTLQTLNSSAGLLLGSIFSLLRPAPLEQGLQEAKLRYQRQEFFAPIVNQSSPAERTRINRRVAATLSTAKRVSGLNQVSGQITLPSQITPNASSLFQIQTGNYRRAVQFFQVRQDIDPGETFISKMRGQQDFGPLTFVGQSVPIDSTRVLAPNQAFAAQVSLIGKDGQTLLVEDFNSKNVLTSDFLTAPLPIRMADFVSNRIELTRIDRVRTNTDQFNGYLALPAVEGIWSGSTGKLTYSVNLGTWWNFDADRAFNVRTNNLGQPEPTIGAYLNAQISAQYEKVATDKQGKVRSVFLHNPALRFHWNSAINSQNPTYLNLSHSFIYQSNRLSYALTPGVIIFADDRKITPVGFLQGQLQIGQKFNIQSSTEVGEDIFFNIEARQQIVPQWSVGTYFQNYRSSNRGLSTRINGHSYGLLLQHQSAKSGIAWKLKAGKTDRDWEGRIEGGLQF